MTQLSWARYANKSLNIKIGKYLTCGYVVHKLQYYTFIQKSADCTVEFIVNEDRDEGAEVTYLSARLLRLDRSFY